jgi:hypothetical protein
VLFVSGFYEAAQVGEDELALIATLKRSAIGSLKVTMYFA